MAQTAPQDKAFLRHIAQCCQDTNFCGYHHILFGGNCVQHDMKLELTTYELLHVLSVSLTNKMHLTELLNKTNFQNDKERLDSSEPLLFDLNF